jgi:protocatechuate 3,4-dioxygenase beta subunit
VRENIIEDEQGVEMILDTQVIDMATCDPVPDAMIEIWRRSDAVVQRNSTDN